MVDSKITIISYIVFTLTCCFLSECSHYLDVKFAGILATILMYVPVLLMINFKELCMFPEIKYLVAMGMIIPHSLGHSYISGSFENMMYHSTVDILLHELQLVYVDYYTSKYKRSNIFNTSLIILHVGNTVCLFFSLPYFTDYNLWLFKISSFAPAITSCLFAGALLVGSNYNHSGWNSIFTFMVVYTIVVYGYLFTDEENVTHFINSRFFEAYFACACMVGYISEHNKIF